jgi:hypothetical protein
VYPNNGIAEVVFIAKFCFRINESNSSGLLHFA